MERKLGRGKNDRLWKEIRPKKVKEQRERERSEIEREIEREREALRGEFLASKEASAQQQIPRRGSRSETSQMCARASQCALHAESCHTHKLYEPRVAETRRSLRP